MYLHQISGCFKEHLILNHLTNFPHQKCNCSNKKWSSFPTKQLIVKIKIFHFTGFGAKTWTFGAKSWFFSEKKTFFSLRARRHSSTFLCKLTFSILLLLILFISLPHPRSRSLLFLPVPGNITLITLSPTLTFPSTVLFPISRNTFTSNSTQMNYQA